MAEPLLAVRGLKKYFPSTQGFLRRTRGDIRAVDDVSFQLSPAECLGLVGESGCGKSTVGRTILRATAPTGGQILLRVDGKTVDLARAAPRQLRDIRRHLQLVFQDPYSSLNPRLTVSEIVGDPLLVNGMKSRAEREARVLQLLELVGLRGHHLQRYPHAFSGGQRQRLVIARALALRPRLLVADEPTSALDVSVQAQILNLLLELQQSMGLTYLFISHDLGVIRHLCDRILVMYAGQIVESGTVDAVFSTPRHPYTAALLSAMPSLAAPKPVAGGKLLCGEVPNPRRPPSGCRFHPRCPFAEPPCGVEVPRLRGLSPGSEVRCHRAEELNLTAR